MGQLAGQSFTVFPVFPPGRIRKTRETPGGTVDAQLQDMMIAALVVGGLFVMGLVLGLVAAKTAPVGFQDEKGFHFGPEQTAAHSEPTFAFEVPHAEAA